jgi:O-antigen/teichoic acid export membrane protein
VVVIAGIVAVGLIASPLLTVAFGREFESGVGATHVLLVGMIPLTLFRLLAGDLKGRGRAGVVSIAAAVALLVTAVGDLVLLRVLGIVGAAAVSALAYATAALVLVIVLRGSYALRAVDLVPRVADVAELAHQLIALRLRRLPARGHEPG